MSLQFSSLEAILAKTQKEQLVWVCKHFKPISRHFKIDRWILEILKFQRILQIHSPWFPQAKHFFSFLR